MNYVAQMKNIVPPSVFTPLVWPYVHCETHIQMWKFLRHFLQQRFTEQVPLSHFNPGFNFLYSSTKRFPFFPIKIFICHKIIFMGSIICCVKFTTNVWFINLFPHTDFLLTLTSAIFRFSVGLLVCCFCGQSLYQAHAPWIKFCRFKFCQRHCFIFSIFSLL